MSTTPPPPRFLQVFVGGLQAFEATVFGGAGALLDGSAFSMRRIHARESVKWWWVERG